MLLPFLALFLAVQDHAQKLDEWVAEQSKDPGAPSASRLYYLKALEATLRGMPEAAEHGYGKALESDPEFAAAANGRGFAYLRADKPARAAELLALDTERFPDEWSILHNLGTAHFAQKKYEDAVRWYDRAVPKAAHPQESAESLHAIGESQIQLKQWEGALESFQGALVYDPIRDDTRQRIAVVQAYLWRKSPPKLDPAQLLADYVARLTLLRADANSLADRISSAIDRYLEGADRVVAQQGRDLRKFEELFRMLERGETPPSDPQYDPGCKDEALGPGPDTCAFRGCLDVLRLMARDLTPWAWTFGLVGPLGLPSSQAAEEWPPTRAALREELRRTYVQSLKQYSTRLDEILAILNRVRAKPDAAGIEEAATSLGEVPLMARMILLWKRWMEISLPALQGAWDWLLGTAEKMADGEEDWIPQAHKLHRLWHGGKTGFEYALKKLCAINDTCCARIHRRLENLYASLRERGRTHLRRYREAFAKDVEQIDDWYYAPLRLQGNYKGLYEFVQITSGSPEKPMAMFDAHTWGLTGSLMDYPKIACYVCSHACGHNDYQKIQYLPFDITFSLCGTFTFKIGGGGEFELKMGRGLYGSVYFNPATLDYGARIGAEYRGADFFVFRDPTNPDYLFYKELGTLPGRGRLGAPDGPLQQMVPGKVYYVPATKSIGMIPVRPKKPEPKWSCGISLSTIPSVYVDFHFGPDGEAVSLKGKLRGRAQFGGALGAVAGGPSADTTIWQLYASPPRGAKK